MDLKALEGKSHQLVSSLAFETCFLALTFSSPKKILDLSHGFVSSSSSECWSPGDNISFSSLVIALPSWGTRKGWFWNSLIPGVEGSVFWTYREDSPQTWGPIVSRDLCGARLTLSFGSSLGIILRAHFL